MDVTDELNEMLPRMGIKLKDLRLAKKETLRSAAAHVHLSEAILRKIEQGKYPNLKLNTVGALADYYHVHFKELISLEE